ncbi:MAG TPA: hypothetical protein VH643_04475 [Gemmataceae bacterium]|jgi:hypothetical protein
MTRIGTRLAGAALLAGLSLCGALTAATADSDISFKKRGDEEKRFVAAVGTAIVKAAHKTAKKIELVKHEYSKPKANRTELTIKMEYHGAVSGKRYVADIVVKIDSSNKDAWEVLNIDYADNNTVPYNEKKIQELIKQMNK